MVGGPQCLPVPFRPSQETVVIAASSILNRQKNHLLGDNKALAIANESDGAVMGLQASGRPECSLETPSHTVQPAATTPQAYGRAYTPGLQKFTWH